MDVHRQRRWLRGHLGSKLLGAFNTWPYLPCYYRYLFCPSQTTSQDLVSFLAGQYCPSQMDVSRSRVPSSVRMSWVVEVLHEYRLITQRL